MADGVVLVPAAADSNLGDAYAFAPALVAYGDEPDSPERDFHPSDVGLLLRSAVVIPDGWLGWFPAWLWYLAATIVGWGIFALWQGESVSEALGAALLGPVFSIVIVAQIAFYLASFLFALFFISLIPILGTGHAILLGTMVDFLKALYRNFFIGNQVRIGEQRFWDLLRSDPKKRLATSRIILSRFDHLRRAWRRYDEDREAGADRVVYFRRQRVDDRVCVQYWLFYLYNDWANQHEVDWETLSVVGRTGGGPEVVSCSAHNNWKWRSAADTVASAPWAGSRPTLFVARGSHAMYFRFREHGYLASETHARQIRLPLVGLRLTSRASLRTRSDVVARHPSTEGALLTYRLVELPDPPDPGGPATDPPPAWWLAFRGSWGWDDLSKRSRGPALRLSWADPVAAVRAGIPDPDADVSDAYRAV